MRGKALVLNFTGYSGWDILLSLLPKSWQTRTVARRYMNFMTPRFGEPPDPRKTDIVVQMPWGTYRVLDEHGNVEPYPHVSIPN